MHLIETEAGRRAVYHRPNGAPTIIFETGVGADSADWTVVEDEVAPIASVFRYDRAGRGGSEAVDGTRDARGMVDELRMLLKAANVRAPYLLVGHSFGGLLMRMLAHDMKQDVLGLVLVDSTHPDQFDALRKALPPPAPDDPETLTQLRALWTDGWRQPEANPERIDMQRSLQQAREIASLGDLPLHVVTSGVGLHLPGLSEALRTRLQSVWDRLQADLTGLSSRAIQTRRLESDHFIQKDDPAAVVAAIRDVMARAENV